VWVSWIEPYRLEVVRADVALAAEREGREPITVGVLADLQTTSVGDFEREAVARLVAAEPDVIVIPGDVFQGEYERFDEVLPAFRELFAGLHAPGGVYFAPGNCDGAYPYERLFDGTDVQVLVNEWVEVKVRDRRLTIAGSDWWFRDPGPRQFARELEALPGDGDVRLLVSHFPGTVHNLRPGTRVDLVIAGHTHGGQVQLPLFGPPLTLSFAPRRVAAGGLHVLDGKRVYVSRGVGMERKQAPRLRFLCRPEVTVLTLR
jgi:predicted MPP superfamily phosphohydrolase